VIVQGVDDEDDSRTMLRPFLGRTRAADHEPAGAAATGMAATGVADADDTSEIADVRFYTMTGGRSRASVPLEFESMLRITHVGRELRPTFTFERAAIAELCASETLSVAEISAKIDRPIGVVRVVCGDLVADGALQAFTSTPSVVDDVSLITRLIAGVRAL
jgi:hypothetical protein